VPPLFDGGAYYDEHCVITALRWVKVRRMRVGVEDGSDEHAARVRYCGAEERTSGDRAQRRPRRKRDWLYSPAVRRLGETLARF
jgi:hypothetical protein